MDEILYEYLDYGSYLLDYETNFYLSENIKYAGAEFNRLHTRRVRLPEGKGNIIYLMSNSFDKTIGMINNDNFIIPTIYKRLFYPKVITGRFLGKRYKVNVRKQVNERNNIIKNSTILNPYPSMNLVGGEENVLFSISDIFAAIEPIMQKLSVTKLYNSFWNEFISILNKLSPNKIDGDKNSNNRIIIIDADSFNFKNGASLNDNKTNPLFLLYLAYFKTRDLSKLNVNIDMMICHKNTFIKFNPSLLNNKQVWAVFRKSLFRIMNSNFDDYTDTLSDEDRREIIPPSREHTLKNVIDYVTDPYTKMVSPETKNVLNNAIEKSIKKKADNIYQMNKELRTANPTIEVPKTISSKSVIHTNPSLTPLDREAENYFKSLGNYEPVTTKTNLTIDDDDDEDLEIIDYNDYEDGLIDDVEEVLTSDEEISMEVLEDIQDRVVPLDNPKTSPVNSERDRKLREEQKKVIVKNNTIEEILDMDSSNVLIERDDKSNVMHTSNKNMYDIAFNNFDKTYIDKLLAKDIVECFDRLKDNDPPFYITGIDIVDSSNSFNLKETWTVRLKDELGKNHTIKVDIPKFIDNRFMYIESNKWIILKQNLYNPLVKDTPDEVIITTNFFKITLKRKSTKSISSIERIFSLYKKLEKSGDSNIFIAGDSTKANMKYVSSLEYDELSRRLFKFSSEGCEIYFSRDYIKENLSDKIPTNITGKEFFIGTENNIPILIDENTGLDRQGRTIVEIIAANLNETNKLLYQTIKAPSQSMYVTNKLAGETIPIIVTLLIWIGLTKTLDKMNIKWKFHANEKRIPQQTSTLKYIRFADGILEYESKTFAELILNGLSLVHPEKKQFQEFDTESCYGEYIYSKWGNYKGIMEIKTFHQFLMDPITERTCKDMKIPHDAPGLLIHAVKLLCDNACVSKASDKSYRTRSIEIIPGILYSCIATQYKKHVNSGGSVPMTLKQKCVIDRLIAEKTVEAYSTLNPVAEMNKMYTISSKGYRGSNSAFSYEDEAKRSYDPSSIGKLSMISSPDANVGINKVLVVEPTISNARGYRDQVDDIDTLKDINIFSPVEMLTPGTARGDDPIRTAIAAKQSQHVVPVVDAVPALISNGYDEAVQFALSDDFVINADEDGKVIDVNNEIGFIMVQYKSGKTKAINIKPEIVKNSSNAFYLANQLTPTHTKIGETFKKNEPLAYHDKYFTYNKMNGLRYAIGPNVKVAFMSTYNTYEDAGICTELLADRMATKIVYNEKGKFRRNNNIISMVEIGDHVNIGDSLINFDVSVEDDELSKYLSKLSDENKELLEEETRNDIKAGHAGKVIDIKIYTLLNPDSLSPSLGKIIQKYFDKGIDKKKYLEQFDDSDGIVKAGYMLTDSTEPLVSRYNSIKGDKGIDVLIEIYIEHVDVMGVGDKVALYGPNKQIISEVIPKGYEPYSEFRPDEEISVLTSPGTIARRMTASILAIAAAMKIMVELKRKVKTLKTRDQIEKIIYNTFTAIDPSGTNTAKYKSLFGNMNDTKFNKFMKDFLDDPKAEFCLDIEEFNHEVKMDYCEEAAKVLGIPLMEYVYMPHLTMDKKRVIVSKEKCLVGYINVKRTQQLLHKKNSLSLSNETRSAITGQVTSTANHKDKNARDSDIEASMLVSLGANRILQELHGPRSDDLVMKQQMNQSIATKGYVLLDELDNISTNKVTLNTVNTYILSMMLKTDIVSDGYILPKTSKEVFK